MPFADAGAAGHGRHRTDALPLLRRRAAATTLGISLLAGASLAPVCAADTGEAAAPAAATVTSSAQPTTAELSSAFASLAHSRVANGVIAVVDGEPITLRELKAYGVKGAPFLPPAIREDRLALLQTMIERRLLRSEFERNGISASDEMVERYIAGVLEDSKQSRADLDKALAAAGLGWDEYFERMREEVQRMTLVNIQIRARVNVPDEEVRRVWETDPGFLESGKVEIAMIFLPVPLDQATAQAVRAEAQKVRGEAESDFGDAARKYSKGPAAAEGGYLGEFERGTLAPHLEAALSGLDKGEVSEPVPGTGGLYIVKLVDVHSEGRRPYEEVKEQLREKIYEKRLAERYQKWANEDLRREHRVEILAADLVRLSAAAGS